MNKSPPQSVLSLLVGFSCKDKKNSKYDTRNVIDGDAFACDGVPFYEHRGTACHRKDTQSFDVYPYARPVRVLPARLSPFPLTAADLSENRHRSPLSSENNYTPAPVRVQIDVSVFYGIVKSVESVYRNVHIHNSVVVHAPKADDVSVKYFGQMFYRNARKYIVECNYLVDHHGPDCRCQQELHSWNHQLRCTPPLHH
uniref:Uncharacterized protein n=1 Tax=Glossina brevipalpis TaxID=37001 RepID=A0A1A9W958_9MUSC